MKIKLLIFIGAIFSMTSCEQKTNDPLKEILNKNASLKTIVEKPEHEVQIIWTQINRDSNNTPSFKSYNYNLNSDQYFYPASTVKLPIALLALEKVNDLAITGFNKNSTFYTDSAFSGQTSVSADSTSSNGLPSIAHYIKKILVVSDNDAYNRLYEFLGQELINQKLSEKGYAGSKIKHRLSIALSQEENQYTNPVRFFDEDELIYSQKLTKSNLSLRSEKPILKGVGYTVGDTDSLVKSPFNFSNKNFVPLQELHEILQAVIFPKVIDSKKRFNLTADDYSFLYQYMSQLPGETSFPKYSKDEYYDAYVKFLMFGNDLESIPSNLRVFNKIGQAYGYMIDNAYIIDFENNIEFMLSAVIHVNDNKIYNDGVYEYDSIGFPFMKSLGKAVYQYELNREKSNSPKLDEFRLKYDK